MTTYDAALRRPAPAVGTPPAIRLVVGPAGVALVLVGEHDVSTLPLVHRSFDRASAGGGDVLVDLTDATFFDASVLGEVVRCEVALHASGGALSVRTASARSARLFELAGLGALLEAPPGPVERA